MWRLSATASGESVAEGTLTGPKASFLLRNGSLNLRRSRKIEKGLKIKKKIASKFLPGDLVPAKKARAAKFPYIEAALLAWFKNARQQNTPIDGETMRAKAKIHQYRLFRQLKINGKGETNSFRLQTILETYADIFNATR
ncbi:hypothetical protein DPMN_007922 [Dreissena polymorpha]|uniref:HTH CENPB-type domain-containing protein n=1 Tax=Dreissena polymorpha TaxID=45954 RepID=A0A9D4RZ52_DREPO|nr:hypothetical protein DPMN_007922 [Dreissena polymorpha]